MDGISEADLFSFDSDSETFSRRDEVLGTPRDLHCVIAVPDDYIDCDRL